MRDKIYIILNKVYGGILMASFFLGIFPLIPFVIAIIIGGETGESISVFLYKQYYPWVIALSAISVVIGLIAMYVGKKISSKAKKPKSSEESNLNNEENASSNEEGEQNAN